MGREIKFRAWEKHLKEMITVHDIDFEKKMINTKSAWRLFDEIELMQYTGLKDKNGVDIYEGYVCKVTNPHGDVDRLCVVRLDQSAGCYPYEPEGGYGDYDISSIGWAMQMGYHFEVIGIIYENADLLKPPACDSVAVGGGVDEEQESLELHEWAKTHGAQERVTDA